MQSIDQPSKISIPFADTGLKRPIPDTSQIGIVDGAASFTDGFPPLCFLPLAAGGVPPAGKDFNGLLNIITAIQKWQSAGGLFKFDAAFAAAIGGYPKGARLENAAGTDVWINRTEGNTTDPDGVSAAGWVSLSHAQSGSGASLVAVLLDMPGAVATDLHARANYMPDMRDFGGVADSTTDNTAAILAVFTANPNYRGPLHLPYGLKFNEATVYAAAPSGYMLIDDSSVNAGQPPGYKTKSRQEYSNDTVSDDSIRQIASSHHAALRLNNYHTAGTASAASSFHSILRAHGKRWNGDPIDGMQWLTGLSPRGSMWRVSEVLNTKYDDASNGALRWTATTAYAVGNKRNTSSGGVWKCSTAGTSGTVEPSGTGPTFTDGTVVWTYQNPWSVAQTKWYLDEDGYGGVMGYTFGRFGAESTNRRGLSINVDDQSGDVYLRDDQRGVDLLRLSTANGMQSACIESDNYAGPITGATPAITGGFHLVNNATATNMTNILLPAGQNDAVIKLQFANANTTLKWTGGNFAYLKGSVDVTPPSGGVMIFRRTSVLSGGWVEEHRNF